jgi:hypothetical protein
MPTQHKLIVSLALFLFAIQVSADPIVYALANEGTPGQQFGHLDLATGAFSPISSTPATIQYLAPGPNGSLLTMSFNGDLDSINAKTGAISVIGATGFADCSTPTTPTCGPKSQLSFGTAGGTLYATDFANNLYTVNPVTGKATLVGATGIPAVPFIPASTNPDGSFNFYDENVFGSAGKLYANFDAATFNPATSAFTTVIPDALYQIDANTGHASKIASTDLGLNTIANVGGTVYASNGMTSQVVTLDVSNGLTTFVSNIDPSVGLIGGMTPTPEPLSGLLSGIGIAAIVGYGLLKRGRLLNREL